MPRTLDTQAYLDTVCELLQQGQCHVAVPVAGGSMIPFLHNGDTVYLDLPDSPVKKGDIVLYTRENGRYILHRIKKVNSDGSFIIVGDAQQDLELLPRGELIRARVTSARHKGKLMTPGQPRWWFYRYIWLNIIPVRHFLMALVPRLKFWQHKK
ncbi:MAG: S24/S26 family peptidase [Oscillospiraceae bacterium]|nr:S24/S26 family peptidase [Oscillospiraceae bacterium]